jgi:hypothetical protein
MRVGSPTMQRAGGGAWSASAATSSGAPAMVVSSSKERQRWIGRFSSWASRPGTAAMAQAQKPFMSTVPRAISRPSWRRSAKGSACQAWPSTGTQSLCADSATPPATRGPMMACSAALAPLASGMTRLSTPNASSVARVNAMQSRFDRALVVSNATSRARIPIASSAAPISPAVFL